MTEQQENGAILTAEQLALLEAIQNRLIPAQDGMPGAGDAGCPMTIDRFLSERPALRRPVIAALNAVEATRRPVRRPRQQKLRRRELRTLLSCRSPTRRATKCLEA